MPVATYTHGRLLAGAFHKRRRFTATLACLGLLFHSAIAADEGVGYTRWLQNTVNVLAPQIESLAAQTRPPDWKLLHSCLYYALAGQYLLARHGIESRLESGAIQYNPATPARHGIDPHVWLETRTHLIDCATLPRWGEVTVIPRARVATHRDEVVPGVTRALVVERYRDPEQLARISGHRARFGESLRRLGLLRD
jgi:hypothetical protein